jgi:hypothetical protein
VTAGKGARKRPLRAFAKAPLQIGCETTHILDETD